MTAGTKSFGDAGGSYYGYRTWSGADGKPTLILTPAHRLLRWRKRKVVSGKKKIVVYTPIVHWTKPKYRRVPSDSRYWHSYSMTAYNVRRTKLPGRSYLSDSMASDPTVAPTSNQIVQLQNKLVTEIRGHSFNASSSLADCNKTLQFCTDTATRMARSLILLKKGRIADGLRTLGSQSNVRRVKPLSSKDLANAWLEAQYAWKPLLSDVHDAAEALAFHTVNPRRTRVTVRASFPYNSSYTSSTFNRYSEGVTGLMYICEMQETLSVPRSLNLIDPTTVAWELLPFSFVADWFIPIGSYIENYSYLSGFTARFLTVTRRRYSSELYGTGFYLGNDVRGSTLYKQGCSISRVVSSTLVPVRPSLELPKPSVSHFFSSLALLRVSLPKGH